MKHFLRTAAATAFLALPGTTAMAYEQPAYEVVKKYDGFELRRYAPCIVAETTVTGDFTGVGNTAFRTLAGYIFGKNKGSQKIPMTAPVNQTPAEGVKIPMTAPVTQTPAAATSSFVFCFYMPSSETLDTLPEPEDPRVRLRQVPARTVAARTYHGGWSEKLYREHEAALLDAIRTAGLTPAGPPEFARYNSPFTLWFLRKNEVLVETRE
jgi:hypothetical protein